MKLKQFILLFLLVISYGCSDNFDNYTFIPTNHTNMKFTNSTQLCFQIAELSSFIYTYKTEGYVTFLKDDGDHWQNPYETYNKKTGDCEDVAVLKMCWAYYSFGVKGEIYIVKQIPSNGYHAVFYYDGYFYDWHLYKYEEYIKWNEVDDIYSYSDALKKCY